MNKQKTVDSKVLAILRECPETRYDDMQLILCYYNRYSYMRVGDLPLEDIVNNYKGYGLPCFETISEEEALKLMNCGLFKTYRVGNEYRASKKSVEENKKIVKAVLTYQDKKTMSVPDVMRILGLGKTATYRLINQCRFKTYLVLGKMRVDVDSFEDWYAGQFHYEKVNGERPGKKYGKTLSPLTVAKVLGIPRSTANDLMNDGIVEFIWVDGKRRIKRESFDKWYASQSK